MNAYIVCVLKKKTQLATDFDIFLSVHGRCSKSLFFLWEGNTSH